MLHLAAPDPGLSVGSKRAFGRRREAGADVEETEWNVRKRAEMATEHPQATVRSLVNGTGFGSVAAAGVPPLRQELTRRPMTDE